MQIKVYAKQKDAPEIAFGGQFQNKDIVTSSDIEIFLHKVTGKHFSLFTIALSHNLDALIITFKEIE